MSTTKQKLSQLINETMSLSDLQALCIRLGFKTYGGKPTIITRIVDFERQLEIYLEAQDEILSTGKLPKGKEPGKRGRPSKDDTKVKNATSNGVVVKNPRLDPNEDGEDNSVVSSQTIVRTDHIKDYGDDNDNSNNDADEFDLDSFLSEKAA